MRVTSQQLEALKRLASQYFGEDAELWLFGSRLDDNIKGGDYDFFIETPLNDTDEIVDRKIKLIAQLQSSYPFEDEKIDIIVKRRNSTFEMPIYQVIKQEGVRV